MSVPSFAIAAPNFHPRTCGIGDHSLHLATELRRRGYRAEIFSRAPGEPHPQDRDVPVHAVPGKLPLVIAEQIRRLVTRQGFSHLILQYAPHMWGALRVGSAASAWLALGARRAGMDVTVIAHELYTEFAPRPDLALRAAVHRLQIMSVARLGNRLFATTETRAQQLMPFWRAVGLPGRPGVLRIGPGALPVNRVTRPGRRRLGVFSTLAVTKRFDVVLNAFEQVWRRHPESELVLIGDIGSPDDRRVAAIHDAVKQHPGADRIRLTGKLPLPAIAAEVAELDVYLFPMTTGANTRTSTLPVALGSGVPVVAIKGVETDPGLFRDGDNLVFARAMTGEAFGEAALRVIEDPDLSAKISTGGRRTYQEYLAWDRTGDALLAAVNGAS
jgi:glycosyltransferase involved in cell wall biosynthesis